MRVTRDEERVLLAVCYDTVAMFHSRICVLYIFVILAINLLSLVNMVRQ